LISDLLDRRGVDFLVVGIPGAVQVSDREWPNRTALGFEMHFEDPRGPFQNELRRLLAEMGIDFVDLLPGFRGSGIFPLYFSNDGHFRESGHKLAAEIVFPEILKYTQR
jgi:hypothetical protein